MKWRSITVEEKEQQHLPDSSSNDRAPSPSAISGLRRQKRNLVTVKKERELVNHRRAKALKTERGRYANYMSYIPVADITSLMLQGRYRSLRRRIFALKQCHVSELDMTPKRKHVGTTVLIKGLAALDRKAYPARRRTSHLIKIKHDLRVRGLARGICEGVCDDSGLRMSLNWMNLDENARSMFWQPILLYLLDKVPLHALHFIQVLAQEPYVQDLRPELLADGLEHIARLCAIRGRMRVDIPNWSVFIPTFCYVFREHLAQHRAICSQSLLWDIATKASLYDLRYVFDLLDEKKAYMGYDTLLHYANSFGKYGDHDYALRCLKRVLRQASSDVTKTDLVARHRFQWSCALILRKSMSNGANYHSTNDIIAQLLGLGVKLDILLYNVIIHNAMEAGDYATAFRVYNLLESNEVQPDKYTYGILLHGCTTANDPAMFAEFADFCFEKAKKLRDPWLATEYLYYLYVRHHDESPQRLSAVLSRAYLELFSVNSLQPLLTIFGQTAVFSSQEQDDFIRLQPPLVAIYIMLQTEIRKALSVSDTQVWNLYLYFKQVVEAGNHPALKDLAKDPVIWNAFLLAFCRKQQFANASQLIKTMTNGESPIIPKPNVYSWNIFMQAFFKNDQVRAAERIYEIMRSRGVKPDQYTYGVLLRGYAKAKLAEKIGEIMGLVDNDDQLDPQVLRALTKVHDRKRLMIELERSRLAKEEEQRRKSAEEEEENKKRWLQPQFKSAFSKRQLRLFDTRLLAEESPHTSFLQEEQHIPERTTQSSNMELLEGSASLPTSTDILAHSTDVLPQQKEFAYRSLQLNRNQDWDQVSLMSSSQTSPPIEQTDISNISKSKDHHQNIINTNGEQRERASSKNHKRPEQWLSRT